MILARCMRLIITKLNFFSVGQISQAFFSLYNINPQFHDHPTKTLHLITSVRATAIALFISLSTQLASCMVQSSYSHALVLLLGNFYPCLLVYIRLHPLIKNTELATATYTCTSIYLPTFVVIISQLTNQPHIYIASRQVQLYLANA